MLANSVMTTSPVLPHEAATELLARRRGRANLLDFTLYTKPDYQINWHHRVLCQYLDDFVAGFIKLLMVFMPPRHGKSELVSRRLPAYILGRNPEAHIIATAYSADLASMMNRDVQRIIDSPSYARLFPGTRLFGENVRTLAQNIYLRNSDIFEVVGHRGMYRGAGVGGGITGMGFNYGIVDDPLKNRKEAHSPTIKGAMWDWWQSTFLTRREKDAGVLLTMTRWDMDDLAGRELIMSQLPDADQWTVLSFPAVAEEERHPTDPREMGDPLWPDKYSLDKLLKIRQRGMYEWNSMYQQRPIALEGGLFKRANFNRIQRVNTSEIARTVRFWDLAMSEKTSADYTAGVKMGKTQMGRYVILDVARRQIEWDNVPAFMAETALKDGPGVTIGFEKKGYMSRAGKALANDARLKAFSFFGYPKDTDKFTNALPFAARVGEELVDILDSYFTENFLDEVCSFPVATNDDQVDAAAGAYEMLNRGVAESSPVNPFYK